MHNLLTGIVPARLLVWAANGAPMDIYDPLAAALFFNENKYRRLSRRVPTAAGE
jgi:hypothetical protein